MEVEQVGLNGEGVVAKGGAVAHVGDALEVLATHLQASDIDAVSREQFVVSSQVDRGHSVASTKATTRRGLAFHCKRAAQQRSRAGHIPLNQQLADATGGDRLPAKHAWSIDMHSEAELTPQ